MGVAYLRRNCCSKLSLIWAKEAEHMNCMIRLRCRLLVVALCLLFASPGAWGSPSGLNNIPTTDVTPPHTLVLQTWTNLGDNKHPQQFVGLKFGALEGLEIGFDWKANDETHGHATMQAKYAFDIKSDLWRGVIGVDNLSVNRVHNGYVFPYVATSLDLQAFRLHFGYAPQPHNEAFFAGIDRTVPFLDRDLQLKADVIQVNDGEDVLYSAGFLYNLRRHDDDGNSVPPGLKGIWYRLTRNLVWESWVTLPSSGDAAVVTLKLNYVIGF